MDDFIVFYVGGTCRRDVDVYKYNCTCTWCTGTLIMYTYVCDPTIRSANTLSFAIVCIHQHPEVCDRYVQYDVFWCTLMHMSSCSM